MAIAPPTQITAASTWTVSRKSLKRAGSRPSKASDTESSLKIRRIESVSTSAQVSWVIRSGAPSGSGTVSVTTIPLSGEAASVSKALPANSPCVATACTLRAPSSSTVWAAAASVPPVPMMSSTITATLPFTSPITVPISATPWAGRSFSISA